MQIPIPSGSEWAAPMLIWHRMQEKGKINDWEALSADVDFVDFLGPDVARRGIW